MADASNGATPATDKAADPLASASGLSLTMLRRSANLWWLLAICITTGALCLPFLRYISWLGDEGILLHGAERMLHGSRLYADFFEFLPPGGFLIIAAWFHIAPISFLSVRFLTVLTIVGIACFTFLAGRRASSNAPLSALFTVGWVMMCAGTWITVSHHWFTTFLTMIVSWAALSGISDERHRLRWALIAGTAAGMAAMVIETQGALVMTAALIAFWYPRQRPAELLTYLAGCALVPLGILFYLIETRDLIPAFRDVILFPATQYTSIQGVPFGWWADAQNWPLKYLYPIAAVLAVLLSVYDRHVWRRDRVLLSCVALGGAGFASSFPRDDIGHIGVAAPLVLPLLLFCMETLSRWWRPIYRYGALGMMMALAVPSAHAYLWNTEGVERARLLQTPRGRIAVRGLPGLGRLLQQIAATPPRDSYFFYPYISMMPFLTARKDVSHYDIFTPDYTLPSQYQKACISVMQHASWIVIDRQWTDPKFLKSVFPAMRNPRPPETRRFEQALDRGFELVATDGTFELRRRLAGDADPALCDRIAR